MLNLAKAEMVAKLELLLQQLSTFEAIDQTLEDLSHLAQTDFIGLTFVNYVRRYTERGGDRTALRDLINTLSHSLNDGAIDREQLLGELINQANQLEARTGIYPSTSDGFEDSGKICTDKLEELFIRQQAEEDTTLLKEEIKQLASTYGMFRLLKYIDRFDEQEDYQLVRTLLLQGQEYRIGSQDDREELLESTTLSATVSDWGVEEFLVNPPPTQETDDVFVSFVDQSEDTSFADNTAFRSLFDIEEEEESQVESQNVEADIQFELVEEEQGVDLDNIFAEEEQGTLHQDEEEPIILERIAEESTDDVDFSFEEIESSQHQEDIVNTNPEQEQLFDLFDQTEDIQAPPSEETVDNDLDFSLIEEDNQSNFDVFSQTEEVSWQLESEGQTLTIEESPSSTGFTQDTGELTFSLIEEDVNNQQSNIDIFAGEFTPEPIGEREMFSSASDSSDYDLLSLQEISLTEETGLGEASVVTAEAVSDLSVTTDPPEFLQSLSQEDRQDVTDILDTFSTSTASSRTSLKELGLLELVLEAIGNDDSRIDYSIILGAETEELVSTISEGETIVHEVDQSLERVTVATNDVFEPTDNQDEDVLAQLDLGEAVSTEDASLSSYVEVEEDMTVLQDVPQFFSTISNEDESDLGILEETTEDSSEQSVELAQEEEPIVAVDESEFSFLETPTEESIEQSLELAQEEEPIVVTDESEFSFLETPTEESTEQSFESAQEEEPIFAVDESEFSFLETLTEEVNEQSVELAQDQDEEPIVVTDESEFSFLETATEESTEQSIESAQEEEPIVAVDESEFSFLETPTEESTEQSIESAQEEEPIVAVDESEFSFLETPTEESTEQSFELAQEEEPIAAVDESEFSFLETATEESEEQSVELVQEEESIAASDESEFSFLETATEESEEQSFELVQEEEPIVVTDESEFSFLETLTEEISEQQVNVAEEESIVAVDESEFSFLETPTEESTEQPVELVQEEESIVASDESEFSFLETLTEESSEQSVELVQEEESIVASDESEFSFLETLTEEVNEQSVELAQEEESIVASDESEFSFLETATEESEEQSFELVQEEEPIVVTDESEFSFLETLTEEISEQPVNVAEEESIVATSASDDLPEEEMTILQGLPEFFSSIGTEEAIEESVDDLLTDISQLSSAVEAEQSPIDNIEDEMDALLSEISTTIPHTTEEDNDSTATDQQTAEFLDEASTSTEDDDIQQELDQLLSDLSQEEEEEINIRQFDEETDVIDFEQIFETEKEDADIDIASFTEDRDESDELASLFGDISDEEVENLTNALAQDDGDDSGFFFSQRIDSQPQDDDSEITLLQLFTGDNNEDNVDVPDNVLDELEEYLEDEQPMSDTNALTDNVFAELEALLADDSPSSVVDVSSELDELESLISQTTPSTSAKKENFDDLDALLGSMPPSKVETKNKTVTPQTKTALSIAPPPGPTTRSTMAQNMRVDVRYLDNINNLVGELIVNRNLLQQDQQRLQASLATLFNQIHKLNDVAQRVRDEFDRSLLERSLQASLGHAWKEIGDSNSGQTKTVAVKSAQTTDALARLDEHDELNNLALDIIELITRVKESASDVEFVIDETEQVSRQLGTITAQIEDDLKQVRMEPFSEISDRLPKQVRDLAMKRKKLADIEISGRETMIDKVILQGLNTPINHLITNALVHGIEDPEQRKLAGKDPRGKITVKAYHQGNETIISISDDGAGINPEKVRQSAISKGLLTVAEARLLSDQDTYSLLFRPGFSTKAEVDEEGGRGVGLDAVITQLNAIKGSIQVESAIGKGTTFTIRLPLTLSISKAVVCICNRNRVAFPVDSFEDVVEITQDQVFVNSNGQTCFMWRDMEMPFRPLRDMLIYNRQIGRLGFVKQEEDIISIIVLRSERNFLALQVDKFDGEIEIVIKQVEGPVAKPPGIAGVTVLGDGRVMAICNVLELFGIASGTINLVKHDQQTADTSNQVKATTVLVVDDSVTMRKALVQTFEKAGYRVEEARNGKEAWDKLTSGLFCDLIFTDVEMPQMNGFQLLEKLQKDEQLSRIPVAMLTSQGKRIHIENAANLGAKAYFVKAYTDQEVLEGAERLLRGQVAGKILELFGQ